MYSESIKQEAYMYDLEKFARTLLCLRRERGWTQTELADRIGIAPQSVSKWECAIGLPDVTLFPVIASIFSVPIGVLFGEPQPKPEVRFGMESEAKLSPDIYRYSVKADATGRVFSFDHRNGCLEEYLDNGAFYFRYNDRKLSLYTIHPDRSVSDTCYCGYSRDEVLSSGRDILGEHLIKNGDPVYREVKNALPPLLRDTYTVLGGVASVSGLTVDPDGRIYHQSSGRSRRTTSIFTPSEYDSRLGSQKPYQTLVGGEYPLMMSVHSDGEEALEFLYFVEPNEPDRDPICWIRAKRYKLSTPSEMSVEYRVAAIAREAGEKELFDSPPTEALFYDALFDTVSFWVDFSERGASFELPENELSRIAKGSVAFAALTFTCEHAHYGHRFYGKELHDNFPPNYIFSLEALLCLGRQREARDIFYHFLKYSVRLDGRINYRQGTALNFGASAAEYGMLLDIAKRYRNALGIDSLPEGEFRKLTQMGEVILHHLERCEEYGGLTLIRMCAEADTNERVHIYLCNNLWAIKGLSALASLLSIGGAVYSEAASELSAAVSAAIERYEAKGTRFGDLPPFRLGYTATPATLSRCADTFYPLTEEQKAAYYSSSWERSDSAADEDMIENSYANYRYYIEMLSSLLLPDRYADAVVRMREGIGGELMGMSRFLGRVDDWPVLNYARFLIETGRIEKYLLLMYAHAAHHGSPELMTYHEQISIDGAAVANDCIPSLLTAPLMLSWCFAYESVRSGSLRLLSALPIEWYRTGFKAIGISYSEGRLDIVSDGKRLLVRFENAPSIPIELVLRSKSSLSPDDILLGKEMIQSIDGNILHIKSGIKEIEIEIK